MQGLNSCGNLNQDCCYEQEGLLCGAGLCDPGMPIPEANNFKAFPCLCSDTLCVRNAEYCLPGAICDQTVILDDCGEEGQACCNGMNCNEDFADASGNHVDLLCDQDFFDDKTGQSTKCSRPVDSVLDQSFGVGGAGEKCVGGDSCDTPDLSCKCVCPNPACTFAAYRHWDLYTAWTTMKQGEL
jgi:hypothetical protein